jgi:hypothetical protein
MSRSYVRSPAHISLSCSRSLRQSPPRSALRAERACLQRFAGRLSAPRVSLAAPGVLATAAGFPQEELGCPANTCHPSSAPGGFAQDPRLFSVRWISRHAAYSVAGFASPGTDRTCLVESWPRTVGPSTGPRGASSSGSSSTRARSRTVDAWCLPQWA